MSLMRRTAYHHQERCDAKVVLQYIERFEKTQETMALLNILALWNRQIEEGKMVSASDAIK